MNCSSEPNAHTGCALIVAWSLETLVGYDRLLVRVDLLEDVLGKRTVMEHGAVPPVLVDDGQGLLAALVHHRQRVPQRRAPVDDLGGGSHVVLDLGHEVRHEHRERHAKALEDVLGLRAHLAGPGRKALREAKFALQVGVGRGGHHRVGVGILVSYDVYRSRSCARSVAPRPPDGQILGVLAMLFAV
ncbi:MAG: hypothetical protein MZV63_46715 [Marinilabiliales bacterium]|nr:hypothetical protein [Marinilabiliales bacterium]